MLEVVLSGTILVLLIVGFYARRKYLSQIEVLKFEKEELSNQLRRITVHNEPSSSQITQTLSTTPERIIFRGIKNDLEEIVFEKTSLAKIKGSEKNLKMTRLNSPLNIAPSIAVNSAAIAGAQGLYRATVNPANLMKYTNGTVSSIVKQGSQIADHAGFSQVNPTSVFAPIIVFQVASIVTGQYYLHGITKQLSSISRRLEHLIHLHHNEKIAILEGDLIILQRLALKEHFTQEDLNQLKTIDSDATKIRQEYIRLLNEIDESRYASTYKGTTASKKKLERLRDMIIEDSAEEYIEIILCAERVLYTANLLSLKGSVILSYSDPLRMTSVADCLDSMQRHSFELSESTYTDRLSDILTESRKAMKRIIKDAKVGASKEIGREMVIEHDHQRRRINKEFRIFREDASSAITAIYDRLSTPSDMLLVIDDDGHEHVAMVLPEESESASSSK